MSFLNITDPWKRAELVEDYAKTLKSIRKRNEDERAFGNYRQRELEKHFQPILKSQTKMTEAIVKGLREGRKEEDEPIEKEEEEEEEEEQEQEQEGPSSRGPLEMEFRRRFMHRDPEIDTSFGFSILENGTTVMGNTPIIFHNDHITVYGQDYPGTPGLWRLITEKSKAALKDYTDDDLEAYDNILEETNVLYKDLNPNSLYPRSNSSWKWKNILGPIWKRWREARLREEADAEEKPAKEGSGFRHPLPGCHVILHKNGHSSMVQTNGQDLKLTPHPKLKTKDGVYVRAGSSLYDGQDVGVLEEVPILGHLVMKDYFM